MPPPASGQTEDETAAIGTSGLLTAWLAALAFGYADLRQVEIDYLDEIASDAYWAAVESSEVRA